MKGLGLQVTRMEAAKCLCGELEKAIDMISEIEQTMHMNSRHYERNEDITHDSGCEKHCRPSRVGRN